MADEIQRLRVASYNIAGTKKRAYTVRDFLPWTQGKVNYGVLDGIAEFCHSYKIDVIAFQEIERSFHFTGYLNQQKYIQEKAGFSHFEYITNFNFGKAYFDHGLCILSKLPIEDPRKVKLYRQDDWYFHLVEQFIGTKKALVTSIAIADVPITFINAHLTDGDAKQRAKEVSILFEYALQCTPAILLGDFNTPPKGNRKKGNGPRYINDESLSEIEELSRKHPRLIKVNPQLSLFDPDLETEERHFTYPADSPNVKLDYVFVVNKDDDPVQIDIVEAFVPDVQLSDHRPIISDLCIEKRQVAHEPTAPSEEEKKEEKSVLENIASLIKGD
ncbi:endonuclease/exonuclease/phosphatase family protein [Candidatus Woesearchaeota archaeon]|nr:endonuclease/exonuclease/phosphatase family protein [Candidatus Woesearchaeota archaeon]